VLRPLLIVPLLILNLILWGTPILLGGVVKLVTFGELRRKVNRALPWFAERFVQGCNLIFDALTTTKWDVEGIDGLRHDGHYLVISNHVSWIDIFALIRVFHGVAPFTRFFLKSILIWFPIVGQACWALGFPFMRRHTPEYLARHPEKRGRDLETTRVACRLYRHIPVTILNFVEGTRITPQKHEEQQSPYKHLLRPRVGGISFVLASLGEQIEAMIDVTLAYPDGRVTMLDYITNRVPRVVVRGRRVEVPPEFCTPAATEPGPARERFKAWIEQVWREKDELIDALLVQSTPP
jgi:1-acyl-sn-glycerol-3-phosphate acyltransferase